MRFITSSTILAASLIATTVNAQGSTTAPPSATASTAAPPPPPPTTVVPPPPSTSIVVPPPPPPPAVTTRPSGGTVAPPPPPPAAPGTGIVPIVTNPNSCVTIVQPFTASTFRIGEEITVTWQHNAAGSAPACQLTDSAQVNLQDLRAGAEKGVVAQSLTTVRISALTYKFTVPNVPAGNYAVSMIVNGNYLSSPMFTLTGGSGTGAAAGGGAAGTSTNGTTKSGAEQQPSSNSLWNFVVGIAAPALSPSFVRRNSQREAWCFGGGAAGTSTNGTTKSGAEQQPSSNSLWNFVVGIAAPALSPSFVRRNSQREAWCFGGGAAGTSTNGTTKSGAEQQPSSNSLWNFVVGIAAPALVAAFL
ncbi:hypothetical protein HDV05_003326 [Chytridiales sp. JEL 0842]|nr:hypothetical protein HDV05_003326 [Chytridiales sp. JEL 0842]